MLGELEVAVKAELWPCTAEHICGTNKAEEHGNFLGRTEMRELPRLSINLTFVVPHT